jgi:hypothetical protein
VRQNPSKTTSQKPRQEHDRNFALDWCAKTGDLVQTVLTIPVDRLELNMQKTKDFFRSAPPAAVHEAVVQVLREYDQMRDERDHLRTLLVQALECNECDALEKVKTAQLVSAIANAAGLLAACFPPGEQWSLTDRAIRALPVSDAVAGYWMSGAWNDASIQAREEEKEALSAYRKERDTLAYQQLMQEKEGGAA